MNVAEIVSNSNNENVKALFKKLSIDKGVGKDSEHSISFITNNPDLIEAGVFYQEEIPLQGSKPMHRYLKAKPEKHIGFEEFLEEYNGKIDYNNFQATFGYDIETGKPYEVNLIKNLHTFFGGKTGSGKTIGIGFLLYQIMKNKNTELYIIDKNDFAPLMNTGKVIFRSNIADVSPQDFNAFINYFWLEFDRRYKIFNKYGAKDYDSYKTMLEENENGEMDDAPFINYAYIVIDEYQTLRTLVGEIIGYDVFDNNMKKLLDTVRSSGMCFYFGSQDYQKNKIGDMRDSIRNFYFGEMNYVDILSGKELQNIKVGISGTFHFYHSNKKKFLKFPYSGKMNKYLVKESNNPENRLKENKTYESLPFMLNEILDKVDSDIFSAVPDFYELLGIDEELYERLKQTTEYIPFSVLIYTVIRALDEGILNKNSDIYKEISFPKKADEILFANINFYKKDNKFNKNLVSVFENGQDEAECIRTFGEFCNNFLKGILGKTSNFSIIANKKKIIENINEMIEDDKVEEDLLLRLNFIGEISPISVNSMYYTNSDGEMSKSNAAIQFQDAIYNLAVNRMVDKEIKQTKGPVLLDIEFTLGLPVKKDGSLSDKGKVDLDNLLKATIDGINKTIIADDKQVMAIRAKIKYIEKTSNFYKNNKLLMKVYNFNDRIVAEKKATILNKQRLNRDILIEVNKNADFTIPSYNNMYEIIQGKKRLTENTKKYKTFVKKTIKNQYNNEKLSKKRLSSFIGTFYINNSGERDLDNLLKATIDSMTGVVFEDDKQVKEFFVEKKPNINQDRLKGKIILSLYEYVENLEENGLISEKTEENINTTINDNNKNLIEEENSVIEENSINLSSLQDTPIQEEQKLEGQIDLSKYEKEIKEKEVNTCIGVENIAKKEVEDFTENETIDLLNLEEYDNVKTNKKEEDDIFDFLK